MTGTLNGEIVAAAMPGLYFFRDAHWEFGGKWAVRCFLAGRAAPTVGAADFRWNGVAIAPEWLVPGVQDERDLRFRFLPEEERRVVTLSIPVGDLGEPAHGYHHLDVVPPDPADPTVRVFAQHPDAASVVPMPPIASIERTSGVGANAYIYVNNGRTDFLRFTEMARRTGIDVADPACRILDWGCGCGRLTRHFLALPAGAGRVTGVDIDPDNVGWCQRNLPDGRFVVGPLLPPLPVEDGAFDVIVANSVFSHLKLDVARAWIAELRRVLRPGGVALLSFHGLFSVLQVGVRNPDFVHRVATEGFNADLRAPSLDGLVGDDTYYRQTYMSDDFGRVLFSEAFDVSDVLVGVVSRYQNVAVCR